MRKVLIALLLMLVLGTLSSSAITSGELADLARYFPGDSPAYAALRTDSAFIDELGDLMLIVDGKLDGAFGGMTVRDILDQASQNIDPDADFETTFAWLGSTAAVAITDPNFQELEVGEDDQALVIAFSVTDAREAELFLDNLIPNGYEKSEVDGGLLYAPTQDGEQSLTVFAEIPTIFLGEDVLLIRPSSIEPESLVPDFAESLADNPDFQAAMARLPLDEYSAVAYVDPMILASEIEAELDRSTMPMMVNPLEILEALGPQSAGFLLLDGRNIVIDFAVHVADKAALEAAGATFFDAPAIDMSFANHLPATTTFFVQDTGLGTSMLRGLAQMEVIGDFYDEAWESGDLPFDSEGLRQLDEASVFLRQTFEGLSGLTITEAFGWMTGNHIAFLNISEGISEELPLLVDFGLLVEVTDSAAADALLNTSPVILEQLGLDYVEEGDYIVMPVLGDMLQTDDMDLIMGRNGDLIAIGTRPTTTAVLNGEGGLTDTAPFQYASQFFMPETQMLAYLYFPPLVEVAGELAELNDDDDARNAVLLLGLFESASISSVIDANGSGTIRIVLTVTEE